MLVILGGLKVGGGGLPTETYGLESSDREGMSCFRVDTTRLALELDPPS